jgi:hypothetical protein
MSRLIHFPALNLDITQFWKRKRHFIFEYWIWFALAVLSFELFFDFGSIFIVFLIFFSFFTQMNYYLKLQKMKENGKALFFEKKTNERLKNLYAFLALAAFGWLTMYSASFTFIIFLLAFHWLFKFIFFIPSVVFLAEEYELIIHRKRKIKIIDFSYPNRLRFVFNMISFEHPIEGRLLWKDINMNRDKMNDIKHFLSDNFGKEMVLNPTTGQPLVT